jgi:broad specificity phosphatase PhoE
MQSTSVSTSCVFVLGAATGAILTFVLHELFYRKKQPLPEQRAQRGRLPRLIILVRHGESECNADHTLWRTKPDNRVILTEKGVQQSQQAGERVQRIFETHKVRRSHLIVSPFQRAIQTSAAMRPYFERSIVRTIVQPQIREQELGNVQGEDFSKFRREQNKIGRFWYRFPTGESGADVYDRVKSWWCESVLTVNDRVGYEPVDALVVVSHGLTMRFVLMQLFSWSPTTFHSVWNAGNCDIYLLKKDLNKPGISPYVLDEALGDRPKSSIGVLVEFKKTGLTTVYTLQNYLSVPQPRSNQLEIIKTMLAEQHSRIDKDDILGIKIIPFVEGAEAAMELASSVREPSLSVDRVESPETE